MLEPDFEAPTVLVDMDGVLADFDQEVIDRVRLRHPHVAILDTRQNFYVSDDYPEHAELVREISNEEGFFDSLGMVAGAHLGWRRIMELGYLPRICSSPISSNPYSEAEKLLWLDTNFSPHFGSWVVEQAIITKNKEQFDGIALLDDRPQLKGADRATWQHIIFDQPYNQGSQQPRLYGWYDENLASLLKAAEAEANRP